MVFGAAKEFVRSFVVRGLDGVEEVQSLGEKLFHPFPGNQGIVDLGEFSLDACFEEHDGIVLVLPIVVALEGGTSEEIFRNSAKHSLCGVAGFTHAGVLMACRMENRKTREDGEVS